VTGPEHYRAAEELLAEIKDGDPDASHTAAALLLGMAQVHATLALAAATALGSPDQPTWDWEAWCAAAATPRPEPTR